MGRYPPDTVTVDSSQGAFELWSSFELRNLITAPSEASFEVGDAGTFEELAQLAALGERMTVAVNGRTRLKGQVFVRNSPVDAQQSSLLRFVIRTNLARAAVASADPRIKVKKVSVRDFVLAAYAPLGLTAADFDFAGDVSRDLMTGVPTRGGRAPKNLEPLKEDQAKIQPPETVKEAVDRHLRRHGLLQFDGADGRIVIASPDDTQDPLYFLRLLRDGQDNNLQRCERIQDLTDAPSSLSVFGIGGGREFTKAKVSFGLENPEVAAAFFQPVVIVDEGVKTKELAERRARRENAARRRRVDGFVLGVDGLAYQDGDERIPYAPDTVVDVIAETVGGAVGRYYVEEVAMRRTGADADRTALTVTAPGVWEL